MDVERIVDELTRRVSMVQALDYEIRSSWFMDSFAGRHLPKCVMSAASRYFAWKTKRKYRRYLQSCHWKKVCEKFKGQST